MVVNGWEIVRDERGFWATAGTVRLGPYPRPDAARYYAALQTPPKTQKPIPSRESDTAERSD